MRLIVTQKGESVIEELKQATRQSQQSLFSGSGPQGTIKSNLSFVKKINMFQRFRNSESHSTKTPQINRFSTLQNTSLYNDSHVMDSMCETKRTQLPFISENELPIVAYRSEKYPESELVIDDIIPIQVNQPKVKISYMKRQKLYASASQVTIESQERFNKEPEVRSELPSVSPKRVESMSNIKKRQTYQEQDDPESIYHTKYFSQKRTSLKKSHRYVPSVQSISFGEYQQLSANALHKQPSQEDLSREQALRELKELRMSERMLQTKQQRNKIIQRIRMKSQLSVYQDDSKGQESMQEEIQWCDRIKRAEQMANEEVRKEVFRQTRKEFRKAERIKQRCMDKYNNYWASYHTSRNFDAKQYTRPQQYNKASEYQVPAVRQRGNVSQSSIK